MEQLNHEHREVVYDIDLRSPELDVVFPTVKQQQVLSDLVEDECLADGPP